MEKYNNIRFAVVALALVGAVVSTSATAAVVDLGGGWQASWPSSLDGMVNLETVEDAGDVLYIRKTAEFTQAPVSGVFPPIPILFTQTSPTAATSIVITDESVLNSTGTDWTDFHFDLLGGNAVFDPGAAAASAGPAPIGWDIAPFTQAAFSGDLTRLDIWDGLVPDGQTWTPGAGAAGGGLHIDVNLAPGGFTTFSLKETPTPEPATLGLLAMSGMALVLRRRKHAAG